MYYFYTIEYKYIACIPVTLNSYREKDFTFRIYGSVTPYMRFLDHSKHCICWITVTNGSQSWLARLGNTYAGTRV